MYKIGSAFHTACLLLHFPPCIFDRIAFSTPAFSVAPELSDSIELYGVVVQSAGHAVDRC